MVVRAGEESGSNGDATKRASGCPVRSSGASQDRTHPGDDASSSSGRAGRVWSSIAAWIPFRGSSSSSSSNDRVDGGSGDDARPTLQQSASSGDNGSTAVDNSSSRMEHGGGCPVQGADDIGSGPSSSGCPVQHGSLSPSPSAAAGPFSGSDRAGLPGAKLLPAAGGPAGAGGAEEGYNALTNEYVYGQEVVPGQEMPLSTSRQRSSIPKAEFNPSHQPQVSTCVHYCSGGPSLVPAYASWKSWQLKWRPTPHAVTTGHSDLRLAISQAL